jgi:hypothetical protein
MPRKVRLASPSVEPPTALVPGSNGSQNAVSGNHEAPQYTPVSEEAPDVAASAIDGPTANSSLSRRREEELAAEDHHLKLARLQSSWKQVEQEAAERTTRSRVKRFLLWLSVFTAASATFHVVAVWIWQFFHPLSHFELVVSTVTFGVSEACACVGLYLTGFRKKKSGSGASKPPDEAPASPALGDAGRA